MSIQYGFSFAQDKCLQCHGCRVACKNWRDIDLGVTWRRVETIWEGQYPDVKCASASVACMHCVEPVCVDVCPEEAISKRPSDGIVVVDKDKCVGCQTCLEECPFSAPAFGSDEKMQKCDMCLNEIDHSKKELPPCVKTCSTEALKLVEMDKKQKVKMEQAMKKNWLRQQCPISHFKNSINFF
jgi:anaerobic dimethyl sulfoxide reductase subunit B (iron-sulfur subunit)